MNTEKLLEYLKQEIEFQTKMLEQDKIYSPGSEIKFRLGIISQTKAIYVHVKEESQKETK